MNQQAIGIIDSNIGGLTILKELQQRFPYEDFIYLDIKRIEYIEGLEFEESINELLQILLNRNVKLIVILCDKVANLINQISIQVTIPIINLASATVKYVNDNYENKNMLFLAIEEVLDLGYYQRHLRSDQLYSVNANFLNEIVEAGNVKTAISFNEVIDLLHPYSKKHIDILISSSSNLALLKTEYLEILPTLEIISLAEVLYLEIEHSLSKQKNYKSKRRGKLLILTAKSKRTIMANLRNLNLKLKKIEQINYNFLK